MKAAEKNISAFNEDVARGGGYAYTAFDRCSARLANERISRAILDELSIGPGKRIIDIGCGDGTYSAELRALDPIAVLGIDAAEVAVERARARLADDSRFRFEARSVYDLSPYYGQFDMAVVRGVLHHLLEPAKAIIEIAKVASAIVVMEPNGFNPVLKVLEKISPYHRQHEERSFFPFTLARWFDEAGTPIEKSIYINTVPMFCPDWLAKFARWFEPVAEKIPVVSHIGCGQFMFRARRRTNGVR